VHLAELLQGEPDELIGLPLEVRTESPRFRVAFESIGAFKAVPEMYNELSDSAQTIKPFLFLETGSVYLSEMKSAMEFGAGIHPDVLKHYVVYADNTVIHVLTAAAPKVFGEASNGP
jgi:hypothetical protein